MFNMLSHSILVTAPRLVLFRLREWVAHVALQNWNLRCSEQKHYLEKDGLSKLTYEDSFLLLPGTLFLPPISVSVSLSVFWPSVAWKAHRP